MSDTEPNIEAPVVSNETHVEAPAASEAPAATSEAPAATSEAPAATTEAPAATSEAPAATTEAPASTTEVPASSNEVPVTTSEAPVASEIAAVNAPAAVEVAPPTPSPAPQPSPSTNWPGKGTLWVTEPTAELPIRVAPSGPGSEQPMIVHEALQEIVKKLGNEGALHWKPNKETKNWVIWTWKQYYDDSMKFAKSLLKLGLQAHQCVSIIGFNSPHWLIADVGTILAGGIAAGIYTTNGPEACHYIADHSKSVVVVVENEAHLKKFLQIRGNLPHLKAIVMWTGNVPEGQTGVYSWEQFMQLGQEVEDEKVHERIRNQKPGHCCTLIYTSGTTGPPKAVMISQDSVVWTGRIVAKMLQISGNDHIISYLPLSHIAAQMTDVHAPMCTGMKVYFAFPDALKGSLSNTMKEVRPTFLLGVPRVWEKIEEKMKQVGAQTKGLKKSIANWAKEIGLEGNYNIQKGQSTPWGWWMANALVFSKIREALGLDRCRMAATAAAPIAKETLDYFLSLNIPIYEIYGMSECTGPQTINIPGKHKTGSAGPALPGTEMVIDKPDAEGAGEIIYRGRHIFMGYMYNDKATAETVDDKGFLHSGDIGKIDKDGFLSITGRIKELIITAGGENIPPVLIEDEIKKEMPKVLSNIMVIGDRKKFLSCVITLKCEPIPAAKDGQYAFTDNLAPDCKAELAAAGATATTIQEAIADPKVQAYITAGIGRANKRATSNAQCVQKFVILPKDFSIDGDELTPTLKLKRRIVVQKYEKEIEKMYEEAPGSQQ